MVFLLSFVLNLLITSALLYKIVAMLNPNPEHNPSFQDAIVYSFIGALIGNLPNIFFLPIICWLSYWSWVFNNKFQMSNMGCAVTMILMVIAYIGIGIAVGALAAGGMIALGR